MRRLAIVLCALGLFLGVVAPAFAATVSPTFSQILGFTQIAQTNGALSFVVDDAPPDVRYSTLWGSKISGVNSADIGTLASGISGNAGDILSLYVFNNDENAWNFDLFADSLHSGVQSLAAQTGLLFSILLPNSGPIGKLFVRVSANLPLPGGDRNAQYSIMSAVPLPTGIVLLGGGLAMMGLFGWRKRRASGIVAA